MYRINRRYISTYIYIYSSINERCDPISLENSHSNTIFLPSRCDRYCDAMPRSPFRNEGVSPPTARDCQLAAPLRTVSAEKKKKVKTKLLPPRFIPFQGSLYPVLSCLCGKSTCCCAATWDNSRSGQQPWS